MAISITPDCGGITIQTYYKLMKAGHIATIESVIFKEYDETLADGLPTEFCLNCLVIVNKHDYHC